MVNFNFLTIIPSDLIIIILNEIADLSDLYTLSKFDKIYNDILNKEKYWMNRINIMCPYIKNYINKYIVCFKDTSIQNMLVNYKTLLNKYLKIVYIIKNNPSLSRNYDYFLKDINNFELILPKDAFTKRILNTKELFIQYNSKYSINKVPLNEGFIDKLLKDLLNHLYNLIHLSISIGIQIIIKLELISDIITNKYEYEIELKDTYDLLFYISYTSIF